MGPKIERIVNEAKLLLDDPVAYQAMARGISPYGDDKWAQRIVKYLKEYYFENR